MVRPADNATYSYRFDLGRTMEQIDLDRARLGYIGRSIFAPATVDTHAGQFTVVKLEALMAKTKSTVRASGTGYDRATHRFTQIDYTTDNRGVEEFLDDDDIRKYGTRINAEAIAIKRGYDRILRREEEESAALITPTTMSGRTTAVTLPWTNVNATPVDDWNAACDAIEARTGIRPNTLQITRKILRFLKKVTQVKEMLTSDNSSTATRKISLQNLRDIFDVENIVVADSNTNNADEVNTRSIANIWPATQALAFVAPTTEDPSEACFARTFWFTGSGTDINGTIQEYRDESIESTIYRFKHWIGRKLIYPETGQLLTGVS